MPKENGGFEFRYTPRLTVHNDSNFVARRITLVQSSGTKHWHFRGQLPTRIEADEKHNCEFAVNAIVTGEDLIAQFGDAIASTGPCQQYFHYALGDATLVFSYDNERDTRFYTTFTFSKGENKSQFRRRKPKSL